MKADSFVFVYSSVGSVRYWMLAKRLAEALQEMSYTVNLFSEGELCAFGGPLENAVVALVGPAELDSDCDYRHEAAHTRIAIVSEPAESKQYAEHLGVQMVLDAVLDVGFSSQAELHCQADIPYRFVFDGPTSREYQLLETASPGEHSIPWTLLGTQTAEQVSLAAELLEGLDPGGLIYSPSRRGLLPAEEILSPRSFTDILSKTEYYIWNSERTYRYCESYQYVRALLCGAVPCKVGGVLNGELRQIPGMFETAEDLCRSLRDADIYSRYKEARGFYLSGGSLQESLKKALEELV